MTGRIVNKGLIGSNTCDGLALHRVVIGQPIEQEMFPVVGTAPIQPGNKGVRTAVSGSHQGKHPKRVIDGINARIAD